MAAYYPYYWNDAHWPNASGWGSSGAISGIMGLCQARFSKARMRIAWFPVGDLPFFSWQLPVTWICAYYFVLDLWMAGSNDHIGHLVHVGGFLAGLACADFMGVKKENYEELIQKQGEDFEAKGWWRHAIERYDRILAMKPRKAAYREARLRCLHKLWPRSGRVDPGTRERCFRELERGLTLYLSDEKPAEAVRLLRAYVPPFSIEELPPKLRLQMQAMRKIYPAHAGRHLDQREHADMAAALHEALMKASQEGDQAEASRAALELLQCRDLGLWDNESLLAGAQALVAYRDTRAAEFCERLLKSGDQDQGLKALLLLERLWKNTPKQAGFVSLLKFAATRFQGLNENLRYQDLKQRLSLV
jgi:hypothetical protein